MPNENYVLCPYFVANKKTAITCEDCIREFFTKDERKKQEKKFCAGNWQECKYAKALSEFYERTEHLPADARYNQRLKFCNDAKAAEITRIKRHYTKQQNRKAKAEVNVRDQKNAIYALKHRIGTLEREKEQIRKKAIESELINRERIKGLEALIGLLCYTFGVDEFELADVQKYGREYRTAYKISDDGKRVTIHRKKQKEKKHGEDRRSAGEIPGTGTAEDSSAETSPDGSRTAGGEGTAETE